MFLEYIYTREVNWPDNKADFLTAAQLLVLSARYDMPYLLCEAEMALRQAVTIVSCCRILRLADCHGAGQLKQYCVCFITRVSALIKLDGLSDSLLNEAKQVHQHCPS